MAVTESIDAYVHAQIKKHRIPGVSIAVVQEGEVLRAKGYGLANVELSTPATEKTVYQLASVTKQFTATAVMMLVEDGKLRLDDRVTRHLPDLPAAWEPVMVRHLLNHTSGIKSYTSTKDFHKTLRKDFSPQELLGLVEAEPLEFTPGEKCNYNNTGYFLLGLLIEQLSGKTYGAFLDERIFTPLGMTDTRVNDLHAIIPNRAQGYSLSGTELRNGEYVSPTQPFAAGALVSTVSDLIKWDAALYTTQLLTQASLDQMWTPVLQGNDEPAPFGFGWMVEDVNGHRMLAHGGGIPGFATHIARFVDDKLTVVVLTNLDSSDAGALTQGIAGCVLSDLARKPINDTDPQTTERLTKAVLNTIKGEEDSEIFTKGPTKDGSPRERVEQKELLPLGAFQELRLMERKTAEEGTRLRYRAVFAEDTVSLTFWLDKAGKIDGMRLQSEY